MPFILYNRIHQRFTNPLSLRIRISPPCNILYHLYCCITVLKRFCTDIPNSILRPGFSHLGKTRLISGIELIPLFSGSHSHNKPSRRSTRSLFNRQLSRTSQFLQSSICQYIGIYPLIYKILLKTRINIGFIFFPYYLRYLR